MIQKCWDKGTFSVLQLCQRKNCTCIVIQLCHIDRAVSDVYFSVTVKEKCPVIQFCQGKRDSSCDTKQLGYRDF